MGLISEFERIKDGSFLFGIFSLILMLSPGAVFLFLFANSIFLIVDFFKLILLSLSIFTPIVFLNVFISLVMFPKTNDQTNNHDWLFLRIGLHAVLTGMVSDIIFVFYYIFFPDHNIQHLFWIFFVLEIFVILIMTVAHKPEENKNK